MKEKLIKLLPLKVKFLLGQFIRGNFSYFLNLFPINNKKIVVCNYYGNGYGDNGKYIVDNILNRKLDYDIVWLIKDELFQTTEFPVGVRKVKYKSFRGLFELATAKIWIDNCRKSFYPPKRKRQYYIQTWHSPLRLKKIEKDAEKYLSKEYIKLAKKDSKNTDLFISGCDFSLNIYKNSFWYNGEILKSGTPRCDIFFSENLTMKDKVKNYFNLSLNSKIVLYAPTFRNDNRDEVYNLNYERVLAAIENKYKGEWILLVRLHPNASHLRSTITYSNRIIDATKYSDMQELLFASSILITDFSSSMFDFVIANKLCLLHANDWGEYIKKERELYFDVLSLPFAISKNESELVDNIMEIDYDDYINRINLFKKELCFYEEGKASLKVADRIQLEMGKN